jgi:AraC-like DNA-binding protein
VNQPTVVAFATRERTRAMLRSAFPRRRGRLVVTRSATDLAQHLRTSLVDAVVVDVGGPHDEAWKAAALAREYPTMPFFGVTPFRAADGGIIAHCAASEFADVLADGIDDGVARALIVRRGFSQRFADALAEPPDVLGLRSDLQRRAWSWLVAHGGRPVRTAALAADFACTREHLSRSFAANGAPNLKRVMDLVRLIAAAELAKNPGYDLRDVAVVLEFASSSHLSSTAQRIAGTRSASLSRLRAVDLVDRFAKGHGRSRG